MNVKLRAVSSAAVGAYCCSAHKMFPTATL